ncbi:MAG: glycosyltransferase, partial [Anaerolineae bacterium]|nr:glycosyltransferase [Anaerolineae bacterium]
MRVTFFPDLANSNPYWSILTSSLENSGVGVAEIGDLPFGRRWLWTNRRWIDVLHFHYVQQFYAYKGTQARLRWVLRFASNLLLARALGYRTVFTLHNSSPTYPLQPEWLDNIGHWLTINLSHRVIVHCECARRLLVDRFGRRKHVYVVNHPNFIDQYPNTIPQYVARAALMLNPANLVFTFIGGIRPNKGIDALISAFKRLSGKDLNLIIAGQQWPPESYVEELKHSAAEDSRITLHMHFIPDNDLQVYMNVADVVVLPFVRILTSSSAVLAMSFARPAVVPTIGCLPEMISANEGILFDPAETVGLLNALRQWVVIRAGL